MDTIVLYPTPGMGHLVSMVELGKLILTHHPSFSVVILVTTPPFKAGSTSSYLSAVSATTPSISFHQLPIISLDPASYRNLEVLMSDLNNLNNIHVDAAINAISLTSTVRSLVVDLFCYPALEIAAKQNIPAYYFFTSGASCLALYHHIPTIYGSTRENFKDDLNIVFSLPCLPPIPLNHLPEPLLIRNTAECDFIIKSISGLAKSAGIIVNTFETLEPKAVKALAEGFNIPGGPSRTPPVFCTGPLIDTSNGKSKGNDDGGNNRSDCLKWLDSQPAQSVVFLCFGSMGLFSKEQLMEIAVGLENSGKRFLWVVRNPPPNNKSQGFTQDGESALDTLVPEGFLKRTSDRGFVIKAWAPQVEILNHNSVGGFVTHCGWNSVLESICGGVPMVAWPLYAEQKFNKIMLVDELKLALPVDKSDNGLIGAEEVEKRLRELMETEQGKSMRNRAMAMKNEAASALSEGGSSLAALAQLVKRWGQK